MNSTYFLQLRAFAYLIDVSMASLKSFILLGLAASPASPFDRSPEI